MSLVARQLVWCYGQQTILQKWFPRRPIPLKIPGNYSITSSSLLVNFFSRTSNVLTGVRTSRVYLKRVTPSWLALLPARIGSHDSSIICHRTETVLSPNDIPHVVAPIAGMNLFLYGLILTFVFNIWSVIFHFWALSSPQFETPVPVSANIVSRWLLIRSSILKLLAFLDFSSAVVSGMSSSVLTGWTSLTECSLLHNSARWPAMLHLLYTED